MKIAVYCSAREEVLSPELIALGTGVGALISTIGDLVYGGGNRGMMRVIASSVAAFNGRIHGVITHHLSSIEGVSVHVTDLTTVESMAERKSIMRNMADMAIVLPGGAGTMDELFDFIVHNQLNQHLGGGSKPVFVYGGGPFGMAVRSLLDTLIVSKFIKDYAEINVIFFESLSDLEEIFDLGPLGNVPNQDTVDAMEKVRTSTGTRVEPINLSLLSEEELIHFFSTHTLDVVGPEDETD
ncbi:MAG: LOG family protein [Chitinophagaceae bacterium]|nr:LOG family protein [Chitinophagaceae bacterium]